MNNLYFSAKDFYIVIGTISLRTCKSALLLIIATILIAGLASCTSKKSNEVSTNAMRVKYTVYAPYENYGLWMDPSQQEPVPSIEVKARLYTKEKTLDVPVDLVGDDYLTANDGIETNVMYHRISSIFPTYSYETAFFGTYTQGSDVTITLNRAGQSIESRVDMPIPASIYSPETDQHFSAITDDILIGWDGSIGVTKQLVLEGDCLIRYEVTVNPNDLEHVIPMNTLTQREGSPVICNAILTLDSISYGKIDNRFAKGSQFMAHQYSRVNIYVRHVL